MKYQTKWLAVAAIVTSGLMLTNSLEAQNISGGTNLSNILPNTTAPNQFYGNMGSSTLSDTANGLSITGSGYGAFYYVLPNNLVTKMASNDTEIVITFTVNNAATNYTWMNSQVIINDNSSASGTYGSYSGSGNPGNPTNIVWNGNVVTETYPLSAQGLANIQSGTDYVYAITYTLDPAVTTGGAYNITLNSIVLTNPTNSSSSGGGLPGVEISTFDSYVSDALYGQWAPGASPTPTITSGSTNYIVSATGGGSNYKYIGGQGIQGAGRTNMQMTVTVSGLATSFVVSPFVELIDNDGTDYVYKWLNLTNGHYVLNCPVESPFQATSAGTTAGLDLNNLQHSHIGVDDGGIGTTYTVSFEDLQVNNGAVSTSSIKITGVSYNKSNQQLTLTWSSTASASYTILYRGTLTGSWSPLLQNIPSGGATTTQGFTAGGSTGYFEIQQQ